MKESVYTILNIPADAGMDEIKRAYRQLALEFHPDINPSPDAQEKFIAISDAYEIAMDEALRRTGAEPNDTANGPAYDPDLESFLTQLRKEAFEASKRRAKEKIEREKKQEEEFRQSGLYDLTLAGRYLLHALALLLAPALILFPVVIAIKNDPAAFLYLFFFWLTGLFLLNYIYSQRNTWFKLGSFHFKPKDLYDRLIFLNPVTDQACCYCRKRTANGIPHKHSLLIVRDVILQNSGPLQHQAHYKRSYTSILIPRSHKAYLVHLAVSFVKIAAIVSCMVFLPVPSLIWRFIIGLFSTGLVSLFILLLTGTRSKVSYLFTPSLLIRILIWMGVIMACSDFQSNFMIWSTDYMILGITLVAFSLDMVAEPIARMLFRKKSNIPFIHQSEPLMELYRKGYQNCLDIPVWSSIYPLFRWLF
jgi:hypothetical protein